jgi:glutamine synthetase
MREEAGAGTTIDGIEALRETVSRLVAAGELETVGLGGSDFNGIFRGKHVPAEAFLANIESPMSLGDMVFALDPVDGVTVEGPPTGWWPISERGLREMRCIPAPETFRIVPWRHRTAVALCDFAFTDGTPVDAAPRAVLRRVVERARSMGLEPKVGYELEFVVFRETAASARDKGFRDLEPFGRRQAWSMLRAGLDDDMLRVLRTGLTEFGIPIEGWTTEGADAQYEINVPYCDALDAADRALLHRFAVKELAEREGLIATFMARPPQSIYGSSMHLHQSLWRADGSNALHDPAGEHGLTDLARHFIAGQLAHQHELTALFAPHVNSYKRLLPWMSAGANATWGLENWSTAVRVMSSSPHATRVEFRTSGADANPYLAIAGSLAAGLAGIERGLEPPPPTAGLGDDQASAPTVPRSLEEAIAALEASAVAREHLGEEFVGVYAATRRGELEAFRQVVTDWEAERYLLAL